MSPEGHNSAVAPVAPSWSRFSGRRVVPNTCQPCGSKRRESACAVYP